MGEQEGGEGDGGQGSGSSFQRVDSGAAVEALTATTPPHQQEHFFLEGP